MNINIKCKRSLREKLPVTFLLPNISVILSVNNNRVIFILNKTTGKISWDILHPQYQGKSLGSQLLKYRIEKIKVIDSIQKITVRTSQLAYKFYEKQGFELDEVKEDYWAKGFDLYRMEYKGLD